LFRIISTWTTWGAGEELAVTVERSSDALGVALFVSEGPKVGMNSALDVEEKVNDSEITSLGVSFGFCAELGVSEKLKEELNVPEEAEGGALNDSEFERVL
jgi:hypothetical protein